MHENAYTKEDLKIMQSWDLERKIRVTQTRIMEWYIRFDGQVYVAFSGGKDSTVLLDLARRIYPDIPAVFVDTGLEYPEIKEFVKAQENITIIRPEINFRQVILKYGYPVISKEIARVVREAKIGLSRNDGSYKYRIERITGTGHYAPKDGKKSRYDVSHYKYLLDAPFNISEQCCKIMKKQPSMKYEKKTGRKPIIGTMACESQLRTQRWMRYGCNAFDASGENQSSNPLSFWTEKDILQYLKEFNIPYCSAYGDIIEQENGKLHTTKLNRTGCVFCGFGCHLEKEPNRFQKLKQTHPKLHEYCMKPIDAGGLGMKEVLDYINVKTE